MVVLIIGPGSEFPILRIGVTDCHLTSIPPSPTRRSRNHALALCVVGLAGDQVKPRCNPPDVVQGQPTPMPFQTGLTPRTHPNGRRFWYLEMASSKIVIGNFFPTVLLRGQIIFVLVLTSSISIVQDQKHRQISMQKSTRVFRLRPPTRTRHRRVKHANQTYGQANGGNLLYNKWFWNVSRRLLTTQKQAKTPAPKNSSIHMH